MTIGQSKLFLVFGSNYEYDICRIMCVSEIVSCGSWI